MTTVLAQDVIGQAAAVDPWKWHLHLDVWVTCIGLLVAYFWAIRRIGPDRVHPEVPVVTRRQRNAFVAGVVGLWLSSGSPIHDIGETYLFSAHMLQHLLQAFVVAPLLLLGIPRWMFLALVPDGWPRRITSNVGKPLFAGLIFNAILMLVHWPQLVDLMLTNRGVHFVAHFGLLVSGIVMWLPLLSPAEDVVHRISRPAGMVYLVAMTFLPTVPASFLTLGNTVLYPRYETFPRLWGISAMEDMRIAGLLMKTGAGFLLWGIITTMFFRWASDEERRNRDNRLLDANHPDRPGTAPDTVDLPSV